MTAQNDLVFAEGYDRRQWSVPEPSFSEMRIDPREVSVTIAEPTAQTEPGLAPKETLQNQQPVRDIQETAPITAVFDSRNQLASLIKNAKQNEEAIKVRNDHIRESKLQSRNRYGW